VTQDQSDFYLTIGNITIFSLNQTVKVNRECKDIHIPGPDEILILPLKGYFETPPQCINRIDQITIIPSSVHGPHAVTNPIDFIRPKGLTKITELNPDSPEARFATDMFANNVETVADSFLSYIQRKTLLFEQSQTHLHAITGLIAAVTAFLSAIIISALINYKYCRQNLNEIQRQFSDFELPVYREQHQATSQPPAPIQTTELIFQNETPGPPTLPKPASSTRHRNPPPYSPIANEESQANQSQFDAIGSPESDEDNLIDVTAELIPEKRTRLTYEHSPRPSSRSDRLPHRTQRDYSHSSERARSQDRSEAKKVKWNPTNDYSH
jgi:hypothetical protein